MSARTTLEAQRDRLTAAIAVSQFEPYTLRARNLLARVEHRLTNDTDWALEACAGLFGENGWGPAIDDVIRTIEIDAARLTERTSDGFYRDAA